MAFQFYDNAQAESPRREVRSTTPATKNQWTHVAAVVDTRAGVTTLYLNGKTHAFEDIRDDWLDSFIDSTQHFIRCVKEDGDPMLGSDDRGLLEELDDGIARRARAPGRQ